jgi:glycosyltransferase involved in cell wall biosynthesis
MKLLYYSTAYHAKHGGSNHSKAFVDAARKNVAVSDVKVFPDISMLRKPASSTTKGTKSLTGMVKQSGLAAILRFYRRNNFYYEALVHEIQEYRPNAVVIRLDSNFLQVPRLRKQFPSLTIVTEINASPFDESFKHIAFRSFFRKLEARALRSASINFFVSAFLRRQILANLVDERRDFVLPNGVDPISFVPAKSKVDSKSKVSFPTAKTVIGYVGTLDITKKMSALINAFSRVVERKQDVFLVIVGDGPERREVEQEIAERNLGRHVLLTGRVDHNLVPGYIQGFDIAVHHAANDYMCPLKLFEYMATEVPVVAPDTPAVRELFEPNIHANFTKPYPADIANALLYYIDTPAIAARIAAEGRNLVAGKYTWQVNADTVIDKIKTTSLQ